MMATDENSGHTQRTKRTHQANTFVHFKRGCRIVGDFILASKGLGCKRGIAETYNAWERVEMDRVRITGKGFKKIVTIKNPLLNQEGV